MSRPSAFISYSWEDREHRDWVQSLANRLKLDGVDAILDQSNALPGDQITEFMERAIRDNDFVLIVCTPAYKLRSDTRVGGVGYEGGVMTSELLRGGSQRKFIPVLRRGAWLEAAPDWASGKIYVDLRESAAIDENYGALLTAMRRQLESTENDAAELGPTESTAAEESNVTRSPTMTSRRIRFPISPRTLVVAIASLFAAGTLVHYLKRPNAYATLNLTRVDGSRGKMIAYVGQTLAIRFTITGDRVQQRNATPVHRYSIIDTTNGESKPIASLQFVDGAHGILMGIAPSANSQNLKNNQLVLRDDSIVFRTSLDVIPMPRVDRVAIQHRGGREDAILRRGETATILILGAGLQQTRITADSGRASVSGTTVVSGGISARVTANPSATGKMTLELHHGNDGFSTRIEIDVASGQEARSKTPSV